MKPDFTYMNKQWKVIHRTDNIFSRILALPFNGGSPKWFSDKELREIGIG